MLDIKIHTFLCACRYMNFTKAANELHITQSAVSQQIHQLESYYGTELFEYKGRSLSLTSAGENLRIYMEAMYNDSMRIKESLSGQGDMPTVKIGATMSVGNFFLPNRIAKLMKDNSNINLSVICDDTKAIIDMLSSGNLDFAIIEGNVESEKYDVKRVYKDDIVIVCSSEYDKSGIHSISDLFDSAFLMREEGSGTREIFERWLENDGYSLRSFSHMSEFNSPLVILNLIKANCGVSAMYKTVARGELENGTLDVIRIPELKLSHYFSAVWRKNSLFSEYYQGILDNIMAE